MSEIELHAGHNVRMALTWTWLLYIPNGSENLIMANPDPAYYIRQQNESKVVSVTFLTYLLLFDRRFELSEHLQSL